MAEGVDICRLDYLLGTIATAYKGAITSLVAKDFCVREEGGEATLSGTVISIPPGEYSAVLMLGGAEISRAPLREGRFELRAAAGLTGETKNLQIDIIQNGRHVGTFLLKRERPDEFFVPAIDLAAELRGADLRLLTRGLEGRPGLLRSAEGIVAKAASPKKDWLLFSEELHSFARDIFWVARETYYASFPLLARYLLLACARVGPGQRSKPVSNFLSLLELPLEKEPDRGRLRGLVDAWLKETAETAADLSGRFDQAVRLISAVRSVFPDAETGPLTRSLLSSLRERAARTPLLPDRLLDRLKGLVAPADRAGLDGFGERRRAEVLENIARAAAMAGRGDYGGVAEAGLTLPPDTELVDGLFGIIERNTTAESAPGLAGVVGEALPLLLSLSPEAGRRAVPLCAGFLRRLIGTGGPDLAGELLARLSGELPEARAEILLNRDLALSVYNSGSPGLLGRYTEALREILIPSPGISGFSEETWAERANPLHLERLSRFLAVIGIDAGAFGEVLIQVICNICVSGVFIPDDRLFQREVSAFLGSGSLRKGFLPGYMLLKRLPVYFNDVGATGRIRDFTTEIDSWGNDPVLYFLRKQVHVNASNYNIRLVEAIIRAWLYRDPELLRGAVPDDLLARVRPETLGAYSPDLRSLFLELGLLEGENLRLERLLSLPGSELERGIGLLGTTGERAAKIRLLCRIYQEISRKYSFAPGEAGAGEPQIRLAGYAERMRGLKEVVLSPGESLPQESLFFKRHIAFGIPSVMGSYREARLDAMGELLRIEELFRTGLEEVIAEVQEKRGAFSPDDLRRWFSCLDAVAELFIIHGSGDFQVEELRVMLRTNRLSLSQLADSLRVWQRELARGMVSLYRTFHAPLLRVLRMFPSEGLPERLRRLGAQGEEFLDKATDILMRDLVNGIAGFGELDRLLAGLISALDSRIGSGGDEEITLREARVRKEEFFVLDDLSDPDAMSLAPVIGGKAKNLVYLRGRGLPIPAGAVFPADRTGDYAGYTESEGFRVALMRAVAEIERRTGSRLGDSGNPLFLSVRSGAYLSMPGILSTVLYCGMNEETLAALIRSTGDPRLGWDSCRRFTEHYAQVVLGLNEGVLEEAAARHLSSLGLEGRERLGAGEMRELVSLYREELSARGLGIPEDPYEQVREAVRAVYRSWYGEKAEQFRRAMRISSRWGTAVTVMEMIRGNGRGGGTSVFFTRKPVSLEPGVYGDTKEEATGDDLVYGRYTNRPLTRGQAVQGLRSLEETDPPLFLQHERLGREIEAAMGGLPQEVEATYVRREDGERVIYVLQTRNMELSSGLVKRFDDVCQMSSSIIGRGVGVNGGALSGVVTLSGSPEEIARLRSETGMPVILLRKMTSTDDVSLMPEINGLVTAAGGATSHAAILAQKFALTAVVGCAEMSIETDEKGKAFARIGGVLVREGDSLSMDGSAGLIYSGVCSLTVEEKIY